MKIFVKAKAGAKEEEVRKIDQTHFAVAVKAPAKDGKANRAIEKAVAKHFGVPVSGVSVVKGHSGRQKTIEISD
ncbi:MAG: DUF167 domain-containing protein [Candidatus Niyogibacteria bacterium]|nr:DUF167 domain-containing protein [Candidatus Niyogibacteria bacterium]